MNIRTLLFVPDFAKGFSNVEKSIASKLFLFCICLVHFYVLYDTAKVEKFNKNEKMLLPYFYHNYQF